MWRGAVVSLGVGANVGIGGSGKGECWPGLGAGEGCGAGGGSGCNVGLLCLFGSLGCIGGKVGNGAPANGRLLSTKDTGLEKGSG